MFYVTWKKNQQMENTLEKNEYQEASEQLFPP